MKRSYRRTALSRVRQCELHPRDGLEVRHFGRTRFLPNWQPAPKKAPAFLPWGSRFAGGREGFEPSVPLYGELGAPGARDTTHGAIVKVRNADQKASGVSISDASLKAVQAHSEGATPTELLNYLLREFGMTVRPNHLGAALQRHRRAGQLEDRDQRWYLPS